MIYAANDDYYVMFVQVSSTIYKSSHLSQEYLFIQSLNIFILSTSIIIRQIFIQNYVYQLFKFCEFHRNRKKRRNFVSN